MAAASCRSRSAARRMPPVRSVQDVASGALTYGHRFLATSGRAGRSIKVRSFDEYQARLKEHFIVLEHAERRDRIARDLEGHARRLERARRAQGPSAAARRGRGSGRVPGGRRRLLRPRVPRRCRRKCWRPRWCTISTTSRCCRSRGELKEAFLAVVNTQPKDERLIAKNAERVVDGAAARRAVLLGERSQDAARVAARSAAHGALSQEARQLPRQGRAHRAARRVDRRGGVRASRRPRRRRRGRPGSPRPISPPTWSSSSPSCRGRWAASTPARKGSRKRSGRRSTTTICRSASRRMRRRPKEQLGAAAVTWAAVSLADKLDTVLGLNAAGERATGSRDPFGIRRRRARGHSHPDGSAGADRHHSRAQCSASC